MPQIFKVELRSFDSLRPDLSVCARDRQKTLQGPLLTEFSLPPRPADSIFHPYGFPCFSLSANTLTPSPLPSAPHALHGLFSAITSPSATRLCTQWPCHLADNLCSQFCYLLSHRQTFLCLSRCFPFLASSLTGLLSHWAEHSMTMGAEALLLSISRSKLLQRGVL